MRVSGAVTTAGAAPDFATNSDENELSLNVHVVDFLTPEARSARMARIGGRDTRPEMILRKALFSEGFRYRLHAKELPGCPDIVLPRYRSVIFVQGCFWHRHLGCPVAANPKSNRTFWRQKFDGNVRRDRRVQTLLRKLGWRVIVVWECSLTARRRAEMRVRRVARFLTNSPRSSTGSISKRRVG